MGGGSRLRLSASSRIAGIVFVSTATLTVQAGAAVTVEPPPGDTSFFDVTLRISTGSSLGVFTLARGAQLATAEGHRLNLALYETHLLGDLLLARNSTLAFNSRAIGWPDPTRLATFARGAFALRERARLDFDGLQLFVAPGAAFALSPDADPAPDGVGGALVSVLDRKGYHGSTIARESRWDLPLGMPVLV
jgi:hypothetical protein